MPFVNTFAPGSSAYWRSRPAENNLLDFREPRKPLREPNRRSFMELKIDRANLASAVFLDHNDSSPCPGNTAWNQSSEASCMPTLVCLDKLERIGSFPLCRPFDLFGIRLALMSRVLLARQLFHWSHSHKDYISRWKQIKGIKRWTWFHATWRASAPWLS